MQAVQLAVDDKINPLIPTLAEIILALVIFAILYFAVRKFVVPAFEKSFAERREAIEGGIERAEKAQVEAARLLEQYNAQLAEARTEAAQIREGARAEAQRIVDELRTQAQAESARIVARGEEQLAAQRGQVVRQLRAEMGTLAVELSEKIVGQRLADDAAVRSTVDAFIADIENSADAGNGTPTPHWRRRLMIHAASRQALQELRLQLGQVVDAMPVTGSLGESQQRLADELYSVSDLLAGQPRLRRTLADPSTDASSRAQLVRSLLSGKLSEPAIGVAEAAVQQRWSSPWDLTDALAIAGDDVLLAAADLAGELDEVEDELFRFERVLDSSPELTATLDEAAVPAQRRNELLDSVLAGRLRVTTLALLHHAVLDQRKRSVALAIDDLLEASAARRDRSVARVLSAVPLTDVQTQRLATALSRIYGRQISVRSAIDPTVQGGLVVRVGDEVIDGSIAARLTAARIALAGRLMTTAFNAFTRNPRLRKKHG